MVYASNQPRTSYDDQSGPYLNVGSTPIPEVTSYAPSRGPGGTKFFVYITSLYELMTTNEPVFFLMFGQRKYRASMVKISQQGGVCQYTVEVETPQFTNTGWSSAQVPVSMFMESGDGDVIAKVDVGNFTYVKSGAAGGNPSLEGSRKRKISTESAEFMKSPAKRVSNQQLRPKEEYGTYGYTTDGTGYPPYLQPSGSYGSLAAQYSRSTGGFHGASFIQEFELRLL